MYMRYRTVPSQRWNLRSHASTDARCEEQDDDDVYAIVQTVRDAARYQTVTTLELYGRDRLDTLDVALTFNALKDLPSLQDLAIDFETAIFTLHPRELPLLSFHLRRLVVCPLFPGAAHLLRGAGEKLECLVLGAPSDPRFSHVQLVGDLSRFANLRALRFQTAPDARFLASASSRLSALAVPGCALTAARGVIQRLTSMTVIYSQFDGDKAHKLAAALVHFPALQNLAIETDTGDDYTLAGHPGKNALVYACGMRGIYVSVMETRLPGKREKLEWHWGSRSGTDPWY